MVKYATTTLPTKGNKIIFMSILKQQGDNDDEGISKKGTENNAATVGFKYTEEIIG